MEPLMISKAVDRLIEVALEEDIGPGDITTEHLVSPTATGLAVIVAKENLVMAGGDVARNVFARLDASVQFTARVMDGDIATAGDTLISLSGPMRALLTGERTALNFLQRLSGIATYVRDCLRALHGSTTQLLDTRKTTPGWRELEKYAVRAGGGTNHRMGLYDAVLIKDNHIAAAGSIRAAVSQIQGAIPRQMTIEVETTSLKEVKEAVAAGAHVIMLDNMDLEQIRSAVKIVDGGAKLEVSGGVTQEHLAALGATGVDYISSGALTHSARAVDMSMRIQATAQANP